MENNTLQVFSLRSQWEWVPVRTSVRMWVQKAAQVARRMGRSLVDFARGFAARDNSLVGKAHEGISGFATKVLYAHPLPPATQANGCYA